MQFLNSSEITANIARRNKNKSWNSSDLNRGRNMFQLKIIVHGKPLHKMHTPHWHWIIFHSQCNFEINAMRSPSGKKFKFSIQCFERRGVWLKRPWAKVYRTWRERRFFARWFISSYFVYVTDATVVWPWFLWSTLIISLCFINLLAHFKRHSPRNRKQSPNACFYDKLNFYFRGKRRQHFDRHQAAILI